jgi:myo-inositol-1(or 4)-monophosphatase
MLGLARAVRSAVGAALADGEARRVLGESPGGDAQFDIDHVAEEAVWDYLTKHADIPLAVYTEDHVLRETASGARRVLVIDPIDGTRPASARLEMGMVSIASAPLGDGDPTLDDVDHALLLQIKNGEWMYAGDDVQGIESEGFPYSLPRLSCNEELASMFWSIEFNGHPMRLMASAYAHLVDASSNTGGVFLFSSASFSISRIITGQFDAYVDAGNRLMRDHPETEADFRRVGNGSVLHLFPYDIAAAVLLAERSGVVITDGYGKPLGSTKLLSIDTANQRSCIAAANPVLHQCLLESVHWDPTAMSSNAGREVR